MALPAVAGTTEAGSFDGTIKRRRGGRPESSINLGELEKLCALQCTQSEIASWFGVSRPTIERRAREPEFAAVMERGYARGRISLRRKQMQLAEAGNATMLVWLGKQYLGQSNNPAPQPTELPSIRVVYREAEPAPQLPPALPPALSAVTPSVPLSLRDDNSNPEAGHGTVSRFNPACCDRSESATAPSHALIERLLAEPLARSWLDRLLTAAPKESHASGGAFS